MEKSYHRFQLLPHFSHKKGIYLFDGVSEILKKDRSKLGEGIKEQLHDFMAEMVLWNKRINGTIEKRLYGFSERVEIVDFETRTGLLLLKKSIKKQSENLNTDNYEIRIGNYISQGLGEIAFKNQVNKRLNSPTRLFNRKSNHKMYKEAQQFIEEYEKKVFKNKLP